MHFPLAAPLLPPFHRRAPIIRRRPQPMRCEYCGIEVNSEAVWKTHIRGLKHLKKVRSAKAAVRAAADPPPPLPPPPPPVEEKKEERFSDEELYGRRRYEPMDAVRAAEEKFAAIVTSRNRPSQRLTHRANVLKLNTVFELVDHFDHDEEPLFHIRLKIGGHEFYDGKALSVKEALDAAAEKALEECEALKKYSEERYKLSVLRRARENEARILQQQQHEPMRRRGGGGRNNSPEHIPPPSFLNRRGGGGDDRNRYQPYHRKPTRTNLDLRGGGGRSSPQRRNVRN